MNVHAKSRLIPETSAGTRSETKDQARACPDRTQAIPCKVRVGLPPDGLHRTASNRDSNSNDQWQATATGDSAAHSHDPYRLGICPGLISGRSRVATRPLRYWQLAGISHSFLTD